MGDMHSKSEPDQLSRGASGPRKQHSPESSKTSRLTGERIVEVAREYIKTPWHHAGRKKGVGIDCVGLLVKVGEEVGIEIEDNVNYTQLDEYPTMLKGIEGHCNLIFSLDQDPAPSRGSVLEQLQSGDVLVFRARQMYNHCGLYDKMTNEFVHAYSSPSVRSVTTSELDDSWLLRLSRVYRFRGL